MREKRVELITFVLWVVLLAVFITAAVIIIFFSTNEYIFQNCADMFVLCAALLFGISGFVKLKFYNDSAEKKHKRETNYDYEEQWYDENDRIVRRQRIKIIIMLTVAASIIVGYIIYAVNLARFGYFEWSFWGWLLGLLFKR